MENQVIELNKTIRKLELQKQGAMAEFEYVLTKTHEKQNEIQEKNKKTIEDLKEKIERQNEVIEYYKGEFEEVVKKMEKYKSENERIKNSRWWKLREKIKNHK